MYFIILRAIEIKNLERAEIRRKLEDVSKRELVKRIRVILNVILVRLKASITVLKFC